jgi:glycosyltransferase involved in cell wall biosynthesis
MASGMARVPLITSRRDLGEIYPGWKLALMHRADRRAKGVVVNAGAIMETLLESGIDARKIHLIPNILDVDEFDKRANEPLEHDLPEGPLIGIVNRLDPEKNTELLLRAFVKVERACTGVRLVIAGDGPEFPMLKSLANELGLIDQTVFLGEIHQVPALIQRLTLGVLVPGSNEGLSNTILEYMAGGIASVVSDCGGNRELVGHDAGKVIPIGDEEALADALVYYLQNPDAAGKAGLMGRQRVESMCNPDKVVGQFMELYASTARSL